MQILRYINLRLCRCLTSCVAGWVAELAWASRLVSMGCRRTHLSIYVCTRCCGALILCLSRSAAAAWHSTWSAGHKNAEVHWSENSCQCYGLCCLQQTYMPICRQKPLHTGSVLWKSDVTVGMHMHSMPISLVQTTRCQQTDLVMHSHLPCKHLPCRLF